MNHLSAIKQLVAIVFLSFTLVQASFAAPDEKERVKQLRKQVAEVTAELQSARSEKDKELQELQLTEMKISLLTGKLQKTENRIAKTVKRQDSLRKKLGPVEQQLKVQRELLKKQVRSSYLMGRQQRLKILLNQDDATRISRIVSYYDYLNQERALLIRDIKSTFSTLISTGRKIKEEQQQLHQLKAEQYSLLTSLEQTLDDRQGKLNAWNKKIASADDRLKSLKQDVKQLQELMRRLANVVPESFQKGQDQHFTQLKGKLPWPIKGQLVNSFGEKLTGGVSLEGVVISSKEGEKVRAVHDGQVVFADWLRGYGLLVIIDHGKGYMSLYGYNQSVLKSVGDRVTAGEVVSLAGVSGGRRQAAVYFAIRKGARSVNPLHWCMRPKGKTVG